MEFGILSLLPPLVAILLAMRTKRVIPALFLGIWLAATMVNGWNPFLGFFAMFRDMIIPNLGSSWNATVILYGAAFGGLIAMLQKTGGAFAIADAISKKVKTARGGQLATACFGLVIFFEDYFNALTVGSVMRPITDKLKVSREKLAYIVDSTAAPICLLVPVSTWVVYVMGLIGSEFDKAGMADAPYLTYIRTIPYNFYSLLALSLVFILIFTKWEFGPMAKAENRARKTGKVMADGANPPVSKEITDVQPLEGTKPRMMNLIVPLIVLIGMIIPLFLWTGGYGGDVGFVEAIGESSGALSILIAAVAAGFVALLMGVGQKIFTFGEGVDYYVGGIKGMMSAYIILVLAWGIGTGAQAVGTDTFVVGFAEQNLAAAFIPAVIFLLGGVIAFTTGTSYGTFAILMPIAIPVALSMDINLYATIAAVLSGGILGDHCSPISDTTVLSSTGTSCDHIDHVNTQLPYALTAGISGVAAFILIGLTNSLLISLVGGFGFMLVALYLLSRTVAVDIKDQPIAK
ncbi:MAG: Na+/H+ antiporter NhaC family protein [Firmicutes bacterium]|nr:Na+/H+ antiporter NhaC family protein [Bacillota bacterium]